MSRPASHAAALRLARTLRVVQPADAYAYALVGYLGESDEQTEAVAMALYRDPHSLSATKAPERVRARAQALAKSQHYFELDAEPAT